MDYPSTRRPPSPAAGPILVRSGSGGSEKNSLTANSTTSSKRFSSRSKSTQKSRNSNTSSLIAGNKSAVNREIGNRSDGFVRFLQRGNSPRNSPAALTKRPKSTSPSAWALSPGRPLFGGVIPADNPPPVGVAAGGERRNGGKGGGMSGVLRFFRQKKVSPAVEEENHRYRVLHNRLLQWRFVNANAEATLSSLSRLAEDRLFHVWLRILNIRSEIVENKIKIQKTKQNLKLGGIINSQINLLNQWEKLERKNCEAVSRITRKVSALSVKLPLVDDAKGDVDNINKAMRTAMEVMTNIEATVTKLLSQVEKNLYLVTELTSTLQHQNESLEEMESIVSFVAFLFAWERSVRVQLMQLVKE